MFQPTFKMQREMQGSHFLRLSIYNSNLLLFTLHFIPHLGIFLFSLECFLFSTQLLLVLFDVTFFSSPLVLPITILVHNFCQSACERIQNFPLFKLWFFQLPNPSTHIPCFILAIVWWQSYTFHIEVTIFLSGQFLTRYCNILMF